jgi:hypothetical protein
VRCIAAASTWISILIKVHILLSSGIAIVSMVVDLSFKARLPGLLLIETDLIARPGIFERPMARFCCVWVTNLFVPINQRAQASTREPQLMNRLQTRWNTRYQAHRSTFRAYPRIRQRDALLEAAQVGKTGVEHTDFAVGGDIAWPAKGVEGGGRAVHRVGDGIDGALWVGFDAYSVQPEGPGEARDRPKERSAA